MLRMMFAPFNLLSTIIAFTFLAFVLLLHLLCRIGSTGRTFFGPSLIVILAGQISMENAVLAALFLVLSRISTQILENSFSVFGSILLTLFFAGCVIPLLLLTKLLSMKSIILLAILRSFCLMCLEILALILPLPLASWFPLLLLVLMTIFSVTFSAPRRKTVFASLVETPKFKSCREQLITLCAFFVPFRNIFNRVRFVFEIGTYASFATRCKTVSFLPINMKEFLCGREFNTTFCTSLELRDILRYSVTHDRSFLSVVTPRVVTATPGQKHIHLTSSLYHKSSPQASSFLLLLN